MNIKKEIISLESIPHGKYVGYYWGSASTNPQLVSGPFTPVLSDNEFIQEAMLWDNTKNLSIMIQHTHRLIVTAYDLSSCELSKHTTISYMSHRIAHKMLKFYRHWEEAKDPLCNGFHVLKMKAQVFCGFSN